MGLFVSRASRVLNAALFAMIEKNEMLEIARGGVVSSRLSLRKIPGVAAFSIALLIGGSAFAAGPDTRTNIVVSCQCTDEVGQDLCKAIRTDIAAVPAYRLQDTTKQYGLALHLSCRDALEGIKTDAVGHISAVAIVFTIYSQDLPGEVYEDSSVFRVGKDAVDDMSGKIKDAVGQLIKVNAKFFDHERAAAGAPVAKPTTKPSAVPTMHELSNGPTD
jgi:hypothetical protein